MLRIKGPVFPIPTAFKQNGDVDYYAIEKYVKFLLESGAKNILVTVGTSRFNLLDEYEMLEVNRVVGITTKKYGGIAILTNGLTGNLKTSLKFAQVAKEVNADAMMVFYPERYYNDENIIEFFSEISKVGVSLMIHEMPMRAGTNKTSNPTQYSIELLEKLLNIDGVIGMKEESGSFNHSYQIVSKFSKDFSLILAGGSKRLYNSLFPFGADTYLVGIGSLVPKLALKFWEHIENKEYEEAFKIEQNYEAPFFEEAFKNGWHLSMKEGMYYLGLMANFERKPLHPMDQASAKKLYKVIDTLNLKKWL